MIEVKTETKDPVIRNGVYTINRNVEKIYDYLNSVKEFMGERERTIKEDGNIKTVPIQLENVNSVQGDINKLEVMFENIVFHFDALMARQLHQLNDAEMWLKLKREKSDDEAE